MSDSHLAALLSITKYWDDEPNMLPMSDQLISLLQHDTRGPQIDEGTIKLLSQSGVIDGLSLLAFSTEPFLTMLSSLPDIAFIEVTVFRQQHSAI